MMADLVESYNNVLWAEGYAKILEVSLHTVPFGTAADLTSQGQYYDASKSAALDGLLLFGPGLLARPARAAGAAVDIGSNAAESVGTRYVGASEAQTIKETGIVPNVTRRGQAKDVFYTPEAPLDSASEAQRVYNLPETPTHRVTVDTTKAAPDYAGSVTGGSGIEATTRQQLPAVRVEELKP